MRTQEPFSNLAVWNDSLEFIKELYALTNLFPEEEKQLLAHRIRNSMIETTVCLSRFFTYKKSSKALPSIQQAYEYMNDIRTLLQIAHKLKYISDPDVEQYNERINELLNEVTMLLRKLEREKQLESEEK